jgi:hypothetical protein
MTIAAGRTGAWRNVWIAAGILALTLLSFFQFPGHTYLQQDTQVYLPILERYWNPAALNRELLAQHPHVSFTVYDEVTEGLRRLTGLDFQAVLALQQFMFRGLGILGVFLLATALRLSSRMALLVAGVFSLGAVIAGPQVLAIELEPVPRGFAVALVLLACGLAAHERDLWAGVAVAVAFLYHAPVVVPFWVVYFCLTLRPARPAVMSRRIWGLAPILGGVLVLSVLSRLQTGILEPQAFFGQVDAALEQLQRYRAPYVWVSLWAPDWIWHYLFLWAASLAAFWRVRRWASQDVRYFLIGLPLVGLLSVPASWLLLDKWKWIAIPQIQPARMLLFVTVVAAITAAIAAVKAGEAGRHWEGALWFLLAFAIPAHTRVLGLLADLGSPEVLRCALMVAGLALVAALAVWSQRTGTKRAAAAWAAAVLAPFLLIPAYGNIRREPRLDTPAMRALVDWADASTPADAVFLFPDAGRELYPGYFRAKALRAVYVDWKGGGQVNFLQDFAREWERRWLRVGAGKFDPKASYGDLGIDYVVLKREHRRPDVTPVFEDAEYVVYRP